MHNESDAVWLALLHHPDVDLDFQVRSLSQQRCRKSTVSWCVRLTHCLEGSVEVRCNEALCELCISAAVAHPLVFRVRHRQLASIGATAGESSSKSVYVRERFPTASIASRASTALAEAAKSNHAECCRSDRCTIFPQIQVLCLLRLTARERHSSRHMSQCDATFPPNSVSDVHTCGRFCQGLLLSMPSALWERHSTS
eukprot:973073-Rhodomonas_salina.2